MPKIHVSFYPRKLGELRSWLDVPSDQVLTVEHMPKSGEYLVYGGETDYWQVKSVSLAEGNYRSYDARIEATQVLPEDMLPLPMHKVWE